MHVGTGTKHSKWNYCNLLVNGREYVYVDICGSEIASK